VKTFQVTLKVIPARLWSPTILTEKINPLSFPSIPGRLDVNLEINPSLKGAFKTAHSGSIIPDADLSPFLSGNICVKQLYFSGTGGAVRRYSGNEERSYIYSEALCLDWARILLDLTYKFIEEFEDRTGEIFPGTIPRLRFVEAAIAEVGVEKTFMIEEWIDTSEVPFTKYINNARAVSCVLPNAPEETHEIARFLCFAQHVQYKVTCGTAFTSDYQGMFYMGYAKILAKCV
jgi:hypothetical protein